MEKANKNAGYFNNGIPYNRVGRGPRILVIFQGLLFVNKPLSGMLAASYATYYQYLEEEYTTYIALRKPELPVGYTLKDMADDYAVMIQEEFGGPVDIWGVSTGGSIALYFAANHPELVRHLIIHSSAYTLSDSTKNIMLRVAALARQRKWMAAYAEMVSITRYAKPVIWIGSFLAGLFAAPKDPSNLVVTIEAEDKLNFKDRLCEITAPTLVVAGDQDPYYSPALFRETAEGIPHARLILYEGRGHPAGGKQFGEDVLAFLREG